VSPWGGHLKREGPGSKAADAEHAAETVAMPAVSACNVHPVCGMCPYPTSAQPLPIPPAWPALPAPHAGALPHQQYADLYRETGSDGIGAMGAEPTCNLFTFTLAGSSTAACAAGQRWMHGREDQLISLT
jgi:hypothetical protein